MSELDKKPTFLENVDMMINDAIEHINIDQDISNCKVIKIQPEVRPAVAPFIVTFHLLWFYFIKTRDKLRDKKVINQTGNRRAAVLQLGFPVVRPCSAITHPFLIDKITQHILRLFSIILKRMCD